MIHIFTQRDPFFTDEFLREFDKFNIEYTVYSLPNFKKGNVAGIKKAIQLYGSMGFLKLTFLYLTKYKWMILKNITREHIIENKQVAEIFKSVKDDDVVLSLSAPIRLPVETLSEKVMKINFHCGKLPRYAGMMPIFWQIYNNEPVITITCHHLSKEIDAGAIIIETEMPVVGSLFTISQAAKQKSAEIFQKILSNNQRHLKISTPKNDTINLYKFPSKEQIKKFKKMRIVI